MLVNHQAFMHSANSSISIVKRVQAYLEIIFGTRFWAFECYSGFPLKDGCSFEIHPRVPESQNAHVHWAHVFRVIYPYSGAVDHTFVSVDVVIVCLNCYGRISAQRRTKPETDIVWQLFIAYSGCPSIYVVDIVIAVRRNLRRVVCKAGEGRGVIIEPFFARLATIIGAIVGEEHKMVNVLGSAIVHDGFKTDSVVLLTGDRAR